MAFDRNKLIDAIANTGFELEHYIYNILRRNGWQVVSNRYYIDDIKNIEREIDILAYKHHIDENRIIYYTVLIISCKKVKESVWAFLTRKRDDSDPNAKYAVIDTHSTDKRLTYMIKNTNQSIENELIATPDIRPLFAVDHVPFAFQQVNQKSYRTEDDKKIFDSIITTIKALEYEKSSRIKPKIEQIDDYFYNFNLISVFDGTMYDVFYDEDVKKAEEISQIKYINRHIVTGKESFYKVHFFTKDAFQSELDFYNQLHVCNKKIYPSLIDAFYQDIFTDPQKIQLYWAEFCQKIKWYFKYSLEYQLKYKTQYELEEFTYDYDSGELRIHFNGYHDISEDDFLEKVNHCEHLVERISESLLEIFRYTGKFTLDNDILPF